MNNFADYKNQEQQSNQVNGFTNANSQVNNCFSMPQGSIVQEHIPLTDEEIQIIIDFEEEAMRMGNFERIFPTQQNS